jgi:phosphoserine phosphatase
VNVLHVFDMDGTLLPGTSACAELARHLGGVPAVRCLEGRYRSGEIDSVGFALEIHELFLSAGLTEEVAASVFARSPKLRRIADVLNDIRARSEHSAIVTVSPDFFAHGFLTMGADRVIASGWPPLSPGSAVDPARIISGPMKIDLVRGLCAELDLSPSRCVAYGDSEADVTLFRTVGLSVAVNAAAGVAVQAILACDGDDLWPMYERVRHWLSTMR